MKRKIHLAINHIEIDAELHETRTAEAIWKILPIKSKVQLWGDEIYFTIPLHLELENGKEIVNSGDLGYWPQGDCFCIFFGPTPVSRGAEIRPASPVNIFGKILGDATILKSVKEGSTIVVTALE